MTQNKIKHIALKTAKVLGFVLLGFIGLFILIALAIQLPPVQNFIVGKATHFVSDKTKTRVEIDNVRIWFPNAVVLKGVFLEDQSHDTLLQAGSIRVHLNMFGLLKSNINLSNIVIEDFNSHVYRLPNDTLFNFSFIPAAFTDSTKSKEAEDTTGGMKFVIGKVKLKNFHTRFDDDFTGNFADANIGSLSIDLSESNLLESRFILEDIVLKDSKVAFTQTKIAPPEQDSTATMPFVGINTIDLKNVALLYEHKAQKVKYDGTIGELEVRAENMDIPHQVVHLARVEMNNSTFNVSMPQPKETANKVAANEDPQPWQIKVDELVMSENNVGYDVNTVPTQPKGFDPNHIKLNDLVVDIRDFNYNGSDITASIRNVAFVDQNNFRLRGFHGGLLFTQTGISLDNFELQTERSRFAYQLEIKYASLESLKENIGDALVNVQMEGCRFAAEDLYYFVPAYLENPPVRGTPPVVVFNVNASGKVNDLNIAKLVASVGSGTRVNVNGLVRGLPEAEKAYYDLNINDVTIIRSDALAFLPPNTLPDNVNIPTRSNLKGYFKGTMNLFDSRIALNTTSGNVNALVNMDSRTRDTTYRATATIDDLDLAYLLKNPELGPVSLNAKVNGRGMSVTTANAKVDLEMYAATFKGYTYKDLVVDGKIAEQTFTGKANMTDSNLAFSFDGFVKFEPDSEYYKFAMDLAGADLYALHLTDQHLRVSVKTDVDMRGSNSDNLNGQVSMTKLLLVKDERNYKIDSVLVAAVNQTKKSSLNIKGGIATIEFNGTISPGQVANALKTHINKYFYVGKVENPNDTAAFTFHMRVNNSPIITDILVPGLGDFMPLDINAEFNSVENKLAVNVNAPRIEYNGTLVDSFQFNASSQPEGIAYKMTLNQVVSNPIQISRTTWEGLAANNELNWTLSVRDKRDTTRLLVRNKLRANENGLYRLSFLPDALVLNNEKWNVPEDNFIELGGEKPWVHNLKLNNENQVMSVQSAGDQPSGDLLLAFDQFSLATFSRIVEQDTALVRGILQGNTTLKLGEPSFAFTADLQLDSVSYRTTPIGGLTLQGNTEPGNVYAVMLKLSEYGNDVQVNGKYTASESPTMDFNADFKQLNIQTVAALSNGALRDPKGHLNGNVRVTGTPSKPDFNGKLNFYDASFVVSYLNNYFDLQRESFTFDNDVLRFDNFTIRDSASHTAVINGTVSMADIQNVKFNLNVETEDFRVINTNATKDEVFYGKLLLDSYIKIRGTQNLPKVEANVRVVEGSYFTVGIPEEKLSTNRGETVVKFTDPKGLLNPIMTRELVDTVTATTLKGYDISANISINQHSTFTLVVDPETGDSLVVRGEASMAFGLDPSGNMSLTGTYAVNEGSYRLSVQSLVKRDIRLQTGSTITWSGNPLDAEMNLQAIYETRAAPIDLMYNELPEEELTPYRQKTPFWVIVRITGPLLTPLIGFEIQMPPEDRGAFGGTVNAKLIQLNEDPSSLNKQVFALMVLNRFVQEDPLTSEGGGGVQDVARQSVSKFLSQQLNKLTDQYAQVVDVNLELQSYTDYTTGQAEGRTELNVGLQKKLFNDRLNVQVGGSVDLEGERVNDNQLADLAGDVRIEYALTKDSRYRLKVFQQRKYGDLLEGEINERGVGLIFNRDFDQWNQLFTKPKNDENAVITDVKTENE